MLEIAKTRITGKLYNQNMLDININKKYNVIISMFAVINHLKDTIDLERCLFNLKNILLPGGRIILDLHNPQSSVEKVDCYDNIERKMIWIYDKNSKVEKSKIIFKINNKTYNDSHIFKIFSIEELENVCKKLGLNIINVYENYDVLKKGNSKSKNLQFIIEISQFD